MGEIGKVVGPNSLQPFLEYESLCRYFTTLTEQTSLLLRQWLEPWSTMFPLMPRRVRGTPTLIGLRAFDLVSSPVWWEAVANTILPGHYVGREGIESLVSGAVLTAPFTDLSKGGDTTDL